MSILNQNHLKIEQEEKNCEISNLSRKLESELAAFKHEFGSSNNDELA